MGMEFSWWRALHFSLHTGFYRLSIIIASTQGVALAFDDNILEEVLATFKQPEAQTHLLDHASSPFRVARTSLLYPIFSEFLNMLKE